MLNVHWQNNLWSKSDLTVSVTEMLRCSITIPRCDE